MYTRLAGWWARTKKRGEGTWWLLILLIVLFIAEHRIAGKVNSLIDEKSGKFLILTKDVLSWTMQDTLGIAGMIFLGFLMFLVTIAFIETSPTVQRWAKTKHLVLTDDKEKPGKGGASLLEVEFDRTCFEEVVHSKLTELDISLGPKETFVSMKVHNKSKADDVENVRVVIEAIQVTPSTPDDNVQEPVMRIEEFLPFKSSQQKTMRFSPDLRDKVLLVSYSTAETNSIKFDGIQRDVLHRGRVHYLYVNVTGDRNKPVPVVFRIWVNSRQELKVERMPPGWTQLA